MINIQIDSRLIKDGDIFVAIKGQITDGHNYIEQAIKNGAKTVVVSNKKKYSVKTINVKNTKTYLIKYLVKHYSKLFNDIKFIGITGTNGKTTTAYVVFQLLRKLNIKCAYIGTIGFYYNDQYEKTLNTTPDILNLYKNILTAKENGCKYIVLEASSIGLKEKRMDGLKFDIAVFTNLTHEHLDYHKNMKEYMLAKLELFKMLKKNGKAVINIDDKYGKNFIIKKNTITYGFKDADICCISNNDNYSSFLYSFLGNKYNIESSLFGKYNIYNVMAAIGIMASLGFDINIVNHLINSVTPPNGRINIIDYKTNKIVIDYAHTPDAIKKVLEGVKNLNTGRTYVVFGCPGNRDNSKRPLMGGLVEKYSDYFIITDDDPHYEDEQKIANDIIKGIKGNNYDVCLDRKKAIKKAFNKLKSHDTLLILGKGHEDAIIIKDTSIKHNDKEFVEELIKNKE